MRADLKPVLVTTENRGGVHILPLAEQDGVLAMPPGASYRWIGDVVSHRTIIDGLSANRWYALTAIQTTLGPFSSKASAVTELLAWNHMREASVSETSAPLF